MPAAVSQLSLARIGIIADDRQQQHALKTITERLGYSVVVNTIVERVDDLDLENQELDLWLVDLISDDEQHLGWLDTLLDGDVPVLVGAGKIPPFGNEDHPRWEKRFFAKIQKALPNKVLEFINPESLQQLQQETAVSTSHNNIEASLPLPKEFQNLELSQLEPIVCVLGASLGGPEAVKQFLDHLPLGLPVCFVYAQHIDARFEQVLIDTLGRHSHYSMVACQEGEKLKVGEIMLAPVEQIFEFDQQEKLIKTAQPWPGPYGPSVDQVMLNIWQQFKHHAMFFIFSGMGNDGSEACSTIVKAGGQVWVQEANSCANSSMPMSAVETGCVNYIGTPYQLAVKLIQELQLRWPPAAVNY